MSLIVLGTVALDDLKTPAGEKKNILGGSAAHFSMSARLFTDVYLVSIVGEDFPHEHVQFLRERDIDLTSMIDRQGKTFHWRGEYKDEDFNTAITLSTELGVLANYAPQVAYFQRNIPHVFLANFDPDVQTQFLSLMNQPEFVGLDSMNLWINTKKKSLLNLMKKVHLFVANDAEARALSGESNLIKAAKALRTLGPQFIVIKKGEHGLLVYSDRFIFSFPAFPIEYVVDPTGAGDTFAGGLMGYLSKAEKINEKTLREAALYAATLASFNVEGFGTEKTAALTLPLVRNRMKKLKKYMRGE